MDNKSEGKETSKRGADWEVVSLSPSAYAAAPGPDPEGVDPEDNKKDFKGDAIRAMFMSGHFIFPPNEHENLQLESDNSEILAEFLVQEPIEIEEIEETDIPIKTQKRNWSTENFSEADGLKGNQFFDKGKRVSVHGVILEKVREL